MATQQYDSVLCIYCCGSEVQVLGSEGFISHKFWKAPHFESNKNAHLFLRSRDSFVI